MDIKKLIRPELVIMKSYTPVEPTEVLSRRADLPAGKIVKLDGNENPYGCSPKVYQALATYPYYHNYPDPEQRELRKALEEYTGLGRQHVVCGMGSDDLIDLILRLFLKPGDEVINCPPTFGMYRFSTEICGGRLVDVSRTEDFVLDMAGIKKALTRKAKVIFVASPNNPTGNTATKKEIMELVDTGKIVVVDEAYFEFSNNVTVANLVPSYPNLMVLRTFSKWAGLAGLRIGYGFFPVEIANYLMKIKLPYNANAAAQAAVLASLADIEHLRANVARIVKERERLFGKLKELGWLKPYPSQANFILCSLSYRPEHPPAVIASEVKQSLAKEIWQQLRQKGIFVRYFDTLLLKDCLRISVGRPEDTDALVDALKTLPVIAGEAKQSRDERKAK
ncbi:MAG: histidinol-phosphate transaminase [Dehalococcoidia bacterium]|nr:histidinol-phosphate transaminase [Dehalococcoidia bacterium]MDH4291520.1 histidinol-phosphate transaminase [Dehalococcoidia bacterium]